MSAELTLLSGVVAAGAGSAVAVSGSPGAQFNVYSAAGSVAVVTIEGSLDGAGWSVLGTIINPSLAGELWQGTALPYMRATVQTWTSGTISVTGKTLSTDPGVWGAGIAAQTSSAMVHGLISKSITNAELVAIGTNAAISQTNFPIGTLPANSRVVATYLDVTAAETSAQNFTGSVGVAGTAYADWILAVDMKSVALYGDVLSGERGATNIDGALFYTTAKPIYAQFIKATTHLHDLTAFAATVKVEYVTYP